MWKSIRLLTWLSFCNLFGINEARFSKDPKKRSRLITVAVAMLILGATLVLYAGAMTFGFIALNLTEVIPIYLGVVISLITFVFMVFRAGPSLFSLKQFERLSVLPVKPAAIVISRFLTLYITDLVISVLSTAAVLVVCACNVTLSPWFYISMILGSFFLPLLPMTAAMIVGTLVYAATASMKRKNVMQMIFFFVFFALYFTFINSLDEENLVTEQLAEQIRSLGKIYPPVGWFSDGVWGNALAYLLFFAVSTFVFACFALFVGKYYRAICTRLTSNTARGNYVLKKQKGRSALAACFFRERKRYFSSSIYVMNTVICYIMAVVFVCMLSFGEGKALLLAFPSALVAKLAPFCVAAFANISPTTASAISMEGKHFWLTQTLPVRMRDIVGAKLLVNLMISAPCALISSGILAFVIRPNALDLFWMIFVSLLYAVFGSMLGLFVNMKLPMLHWDMEGQPVKQSKAILVTMFSCFVMAIVPASAVFVFSGIAAHIALGVICIGILLLTRAMYRKMCAFDLKKIAED